MFVVFEALNKYTIPKVHSAYCDHYLHWSENKTKTTVWHGLYDSFKEAMEKCRAIAKEQAIYPRKAQCCKEYLSELKEIIQY